MQQQQNQQPAGWNELAIISGILCLVFAPAALITGIISLNQIKKTEEQGKGIAITGIVIGGLTMAVVVVFIIVLIVAAASI